MYIRKLNPSDELVKSILEDNYILHSITPIYKQHPGNSGNTELLYHFVKDKYAAVEYKKEYDINFNPLFGSECGE